MVNNKGNVQKMDDLQLIQTIQNDAKLGKIKLPGMPDIAVRVRNAVQDETKNNQAVSKIIQMDPALTARLVQIANSPLYRGNASVKDCSAAVTRLGLGVTRNFVTSFTLKQLYQVDKPNLKHIISDVWRHSCEVAAICYVLATTESHLQADRAMLAGLLHDIGVLPLVHYINQCAPHVQDNDEIEFLIHRLRGKLGGFLLGMWKFDDIYIDAARLAEEWYRNEQGPCDYTDVVLVAQLQYYHSKGQREDLPKLEDLPCYKKFSFSQLGRDAGLEIIESAQDEIDDMIKMLI